MAVVTYRRGLFTGGSNCKSLHDWERSGVLDWRSLMGSGRLREVVTHES